MKQCSDSYLEKSRIKFSTFSQGSRFHIDNLNFISVVYCVPSALDRFEEGNSF